MSRKGISGKAPLVKILLITGAFLIFLPHSRAQYYFNENCRRTYQAVLSLQFAEAHRLIAMEKKADPPNRVPVYLENYIDFLTLFIGENRQDYNRLKNRKQERIRELESGNPDSPFHQFCLAELYIQWAFARINFGDYTHAAFEIRKAHTLLTENRQKYPAFALNRIGLGVVHVIAGIIPENYQWVAGLMGVDGSVETGLKEIRQVAEYSGPDEMTLLYKPEAAFYLAFLTVNLQKNKKEALEVIRLFDSSQQSLKSPLLIYARASVLMKNGLNDRALAVLRERNNLPGTFPFYYLDYLEGMARLNKLDYSAPVYFSRFIDNFRGSNYIRSALQKIAWTALLRGDTLGFHKSMKLVVQTGSSDVDEDKQALKEAESRMFPNVVLLKSRLLFDGGYYEQALNELLNNNLKNVLRSKRDLVEYSYRMGRIYHETGNSARALEYYRQTIRRGWTEPYYYAAGAAYQMGLLYENAGEWSKADSAYHVCLSIDTPEYKASLDQKARAGINRIKKKSPRT